MKNCKEGKKVKEKKRKQIHMKQGHTEKNISQLRHFALGALGFKNFANTRAISLGKGPKSPSQSHFSSTIRSWGIRLTWQWSIVSTVCVPWRNRFWTPDRRLIEVPKLPCCTLRGSSLPSIPHYICGRQSLMTIAPFGLEGSCLCQTWYVSKPAFETSEDFVVAWRFSTTFLRKVALFLRNKIDNSTSNFTRTQMNSIPIGKYQQTVIQSLYSSVKATQNAKLQNSDWLRWLWRQRYIQINPASLRLLERWRAHLYSCRVW